ncbi:MAG: hypothetical protein J0H29_17260 [Sphingobacteriales bacterium]|nr:hypothetical protein [Sphingobacteriales bacterium]OJY84728.1 MAG: hypothetical protein BGP14_04105 [Sphingobacteriales bacterium 44-15]
MKFRMLTSLFFLLLTRYSGFSQSLDLSNAIVWVEDTKAVSLNKPLQVLKEEVEKRTRIQFTVANKIPKEHGAVIYLVAEERISKLPKALEEALTTLPAPGNEGYRLLVSASSSAVIISGKDARSVLYGIGRLLRKADMQQGRITLPVAATISSTPAYPIRGHQLGFRPKTNSYDAFSVEQYDQYIRELALFGANSIEILPPRTDDEDTSVHMKLRPEKMIIEQSRICKAYNLDVWMWYPNMGKDYTNRQELRKELQERMEVFASLPKLDNVFVPGGDPGDLEPGVLFDWLGKIAITLRQFHPNAKIWVSPQVFRPTQKWFDEFFRQVNSGYPWLGGVVFGPWVKIPIAELRQLVKADIPIRRYPDITHSLSCQYPIPDWDLAYAQTLGRECINPRPQDEKHIHNVFAKYASGSISYSEGTNDDVNKFIWSDQDWDPSTPIIETIRDYTRLFMGSGICEAATQGIFNLEKNLRGPLLSNNTVEQTLMQWQDLEQKATPALMKNFRFQMCLLRAYYDAYVRRKLIHETALESEARTVLSAATPATSSIAVLKARMILQQGQDEPVAPALKEKCYVLADSLYSSIGAQLTIEKHGAMPGRGNFIDNMDIPLNDAPWLMDQLNVLDRIADDEERAKQLYAMLHRTDPGPGGFYDHFGNPESNYRIIYGKTWAEDPGSLSSPRKSFGVGVIGEEWVHEVQSKGFSGETTPGPWMSQINTLYDTPLKIEYNNLDTAVQYKMRITYTGRFRSRIKLVANDNIIIHDFMQTGTKPTYEFDIPREATASGKVVFSWTCGEGERGSQVTEIWLMRK